MIANNALGIANRVGSFKLTTELLLSTPGVVAAAFNALQLLHIRVDHSPMSAIVEYTGRSHLFDIVPEGERIPSYKLHIICGNTDEPFEDFNLQVERLPNCSVLPYKEKLDA